MEFYEEEVGQIRTLVGDHRANGNVYIAFCDNGEKISIDDLAFFQDSFGANEYCYENTTDVDRYAITTASKVIEQLDHQISQRDQIDNLKNEDMKQENFDYLKDQIKKAGFGEGLENELKEKMEGNEPEFQLKTQKEFGVDKIDATLNFRRSTTDDNCYFNTYEAQLKQGGSEKLGPKQTFYVRRDNNFSVDEAYNLLNNRFVNKDLVNSVGEPNNNSWVKLNFKETDANGNYKMHHFTEKWKFDLGKALESNTFLKELANSSEKDAIMASLKKGNRQEVKIIVDGKEKTAYLEANPYRRVISVTDENRKTISQAKKAENKQSQGQEESENKKQGQKQGNEDDNAQKNGQKQSKRHKQGIS